MFKLIAFLVLAVAFMGVSYSISTHTERTTLTIAGKERLMKVSSTESGTSTSYENVVYTDDEVYVVQDSLWLGHFTSATIYARIHVGETCDVLLSGYRFGFLSMKQNIVEANCH